MKNNKSNVFRTIFWGLIFILSLIAGIMGIIQDNKNFNEAAIKYNSFIEYFNKSEKVSEFKKSNIILNATLVNKKIEINYKSVTNKKYSFKCYDNYFQIKYPIDDNIGYIITEILTSSIGQYYGILINDIEQLFNTKEIFDYKFEEGIEFEKKYNNYIVKIKHDEPFKVKEKK